MIKNWLKRLKKDERGMTLVELLAVVVVLGIIGGIAFVSIGNVIENSEEDAHIANALQAISAAELAQASGTDFGEGTTTATDLETFTTELVNPFGNEGEYNFNIGINGSGEFTVTTVGGECDFTATKNQLSTQGRELCETGGNDEEGTTPE